MSGFMKDAFKFMETEKFICEKSKCINLNKFNLRISIFQSKYSAKTLEIFGSSGEWIVCRHQNNLRRLELKF